MSSRFSTTSLASLPLEILHQILAEIVPTNCIIKFRTYSPPMPKNVSNESASAGGASSQATSQDDCVIVESTSNNVVEAETEPKFAHILSLLLLPYPIYPLVLQMIYSTNTFHFPNPETCHVFTSQIHPNNQALIRSVCICASGMPIRQRSCTSSNYRFELPLSVPDVLRAVGSFRGLKRLKLEGLGPGCIKNRVFTNRLGIEYTNVAEDWQYWWVDDIETIGAIVGAIKVGDLTPEHLVHGHQSRFDHADKAQALASVPCSTDQFEPPPFLKNARVVVKQSLRNWGRDTNVQRRNGTRFYAADIDYMRAENDHEVSDIANAIAEAKICDAENRTRCNAEIGARTEAAGREILRHRTYHEARRQAETDRFRGNRLRKELESTAGGKRGYWIEEDGDQRWYHGEM